MSSYRSFAKGPELANWAGEEAEWWLRRADADARAEAEYEASGVRVIPCEDGKTAVSRPRRRA
jgi:hypothetical protein